MKFTGSFDLPAEPEQVFDKISDPVFFAGCIDGVSGLEEVTPKKYDAELETRIAYIKFRFAMEVEIVEEVRPSRLVAKAVGTPKGMAGRLTSTATAALEPVEAGTRVSYEIDLTMAGKLGSIGQPVLRSKAREMEGNFVRNVSASFEGADASQEVSR
ncbi:MAG: SRPBCC domain-containing protein [Pseudomonadota bacterium]|nr:SRPBCC domain-containing protein [Pseudomonadota bacterium]